MRSDASQAFEAAFAGLLLVRRRCEAATPLTPAIREDLLPSACLHASAETVRACAADVVRLIRAFHGSILLASPLSLRAAGPERKHRSPRWSSGTKAWCLFTVGGSRTRSSPMVWANRHGAIRWPPEYPAMAISTAESSGRSVGSGIYADVMQLHAVPRKSTFQVFQTRRVGCLGERLIDSLA